MFIAVKEKAVDFCLSRGLGDVYKRQAKIHSMPKIVPAGRMDSVEKNEEECELSYSSYCRLILYDLSLKEVVDCL